MRFGFVGLIFLLLVFKLETGRTGWLGLQIG
jgi:hypothetical protein